MKNINLYLVILLCMSFSLFADGVLPLGSGTAGDPYQIETLDNLLWISTNDTTWTMAFIQTSDISASDTQSWNSGEGFIPIGNDTISFTGEYNGDYKTISSLFIDRPDTDFKMQAMFGHTNSATIKNVQMLNVDITGWRHVGALIGFSYQTIIQNCSSSGSVIATHDWGGGLIGYTDNISIIERCSSSCDVSYGAGLGGLTGHIGPYCEIYDSYATGSVNGGIIKGGLCGSGGTNNSVIRSYSTGYVSSGTWSGGLIGDTGLAYDCFWDIETSQQSISSGGTGKITGMMKTVETYTDTTSTGLNNPWDFVNNPNDDVANDDIWTIDPALNNGYPILTWQTLSFIADFSASSIEIMLGDTIQFTDLSVGTPISWAWDFDGDDITDSTIENPAWEYTQIGIYTVKLTVNDGSTEDTETKIDYIVVNDPMTSGLFAHYPFTGNPDDISGNNHHGTNYGATLSTDRFGNDDSAYDFNGSTDYITCGNWFNYQDFTISMWVNREAIGTDWRVLIDNNHGPNWVIQSNQNSNDFGFGIYPDGGVEFTIDLNNWRHVICRKEGTDIKTYIDGVLENISTMTALVDYSNPNLFIGRWGGGGRNFNGKIDDIRMYDRAISDDQIGKLYHDGGWMSEPENVNTSTTETDITITWNSVPGATSYVVYSSDDPYSEFELDSSGDFTGESWSTSLTDKKFFQVRAVK